MATVQPPHSNSGIGGDLSRNVMIVDDDPLLLEFATLTLRDAGYNPIACEDGEAALYMISDLDLDLVILDLTMPRMNGLEVLRHLKAEPKSAKIPVMMLTASTDVENVKAALALGARDYIAKPFDGAKLVDRVARLIEKIKKEAAGSGPMVWEAPKSGFDLPLQTAKTRVTFGPNDSGDSKN